MKAFISTLASLFIFSGYSLAAICNSLGTGDWNTPSTWSCGSIPTGGDNITINATDTVTLSTVTNIIGAPVTITINGVFMFDSPNSQLNLSCNSVIIISPTGSIQSTGLGQANHTIRICRGNVWVGSDGTLTGPLVIGVLLPIELN